jgi:hypothetical protein
MGCGWGFGDNGGGVRKKAERNEFSQPSMLGRRQSVAVHDRRDGLHAVDVVVVPVIQDTSDHFGLGTRHDRDRLVSIQDEAQRLRPKRRFDDPNGAALLCRRGRRCEENEQKSNVPHRIPPFNFDVCFLL